LYPFSFFVPAFPVAAFRQSIIIPFEAGEMEFVVKEEQRKKEKEKEKEKRKEKKAGRRGKEKKGERAKGRWKN